MAIADYEAVGSANDVYVTDDHTYVADVVGGLVVTKRGSHNPPRFLSISSKVLPTPLRPANRR